MRAVSLDLLNRLITLDNLSENSVSTVQPWAWDSGDEELGTIGVWSCVGHRQHAWFVVLEHKVFVVEFVTVDGFATSSVSTGEVASLDHELRNDPVELGSSVSKALLASTQGSEVLSGFWYNLIEKLEFDWGKLGSADAGLEEDLLSHRGGRRAESTAEFEHVGDGKLGENCGVVIANFPTAKRPRKKKKKESIEASPIRLLAQENHTIHNDLKGTRMTRENFLKILGHPKKVVAPMVDQSELAWRILSRRYGADLCYTPMFHARLFATDKKYREDMFGPLDGDPKFDRPLVVQFCANDPEYLLEAAKLVQDRCDAVDLNLGCPQGIAKKGKYGAWLMDDWPLIERLISTLNKELKVPVTAKIRVFPANSQTASAGKGQPVANGAKDDDFDREKTLEYARMILRAGAKILTVHGRTRDMKGQLTGVANWSIIKYLREQLAEEFGLQVIFFSNGNILYPEDVQRCLDTVGYDGVMLAEGNLYNPGVFNTNVTGLTEKERIDKQYPRVDKLVEEYYTIVKEVAEKSVASRHAVKSHLFKVLHPFLPKFTDLRQKIATNSVKKPVSSWEDIVEELKKLVEQNYDEKDDVVTEGEQEWWGGAYKQIPYWRCQPYFRKVDGKIVTEDVKRKMATVLEGEEKRRKVQSTDTKSQD